MNIADSMTKIFHGQGCTSVEVSIMDSKDPSLVEFHVETGSGHILGIFAIKSEVPTVQRIMETTTAKFMKSSADKSTGKDVLFYFSQVGGL